MEEEKNYVSLLLEKNLRVDDRKFDEYRKPIKIEHGISKNAEGSARVTIGKTEVVAGVKMDVGEPFYDSPDRGVLIVGSELLPLSNPSFESGPPDAQSTELARIVDRGLRESNFVDFKKLCIKEGEKVWIIFVDIYTMNDDGNLIDAAALAAIAALLDVKFPVYDEKIGRVKYGEWTNKKLSIEKIPVACTIGKINGKMILDPSSEEEKVLDARLTISTTEGKTINAIQKGGNSWFSIEEINTIIDLSFEKGNELRKLLKGG